MAVDQSCPGIEVIFVEITFIKHLLSTEVSDWEMTEGSCDEANDSEIFCIRVCAASTNAKMLSTHTIRSSFAHGAQILTNTFAP